MRTDGGTPGAGADGCCNPAQGAEVTASDISSAMADEARRRYEAAVASSPQQRPKVSVSAGAASRAAALLQCWLPRCLLRANAPNSLSPSDGQTVPDMRGVG